MEYSLTAYIERQPLERLEEFLKDYYENRLTSDYTYVIPYIEYVVGRKKAEAKEAGAK